MINGENLYTGVCWSSDVKYIEGKGNTHPVNNNPNSGFVTILDKNNKVVSNPGGTKPVYKNGKLQPMLQHKNVFKHCHDVCIDEDKNIYVCQWNADNTYPIKLERV